METEMGDLEDMAKCLCSLNAVGVAEIFSPPRFTSMTHAFNLRHGLCIDLTTQNQKDEYWDLPRDEEQHQLHGREKPEFLTGSSPCTDFCKLLRIKLSKEDIEQRQKSEGKLFVRTCMKAYWRQQGNGCHFLLFCMNIPKMQIRGTCQR